MTLPRIYLIAILLLTFGVGANGQEPSKPDLFDQFEDVSCSDFRFRIDSFMERIMSDGNRIGHVIIRGSPDNFVSLAFEEELIRAQFELREFPKERVVFEKVIGSGKRQTQLWILNRQENRPTHEKIYDSYALDAQKKPFVIAEYGDGEGSECPDVDYERFVARFLKGNPSSRLNIDVSAHKLERAKREGAKIVRKLVGEFGIGRDRIRIFARSDKRNFYSWAIVKYWYLP